MYVPEMLGSRVPVEYHTVAVDGVNLFYREAGPRDAPVILLLHGFPSSSRRFATLIPRLAKRVDPDTWSDELAFLMRPGMDRIQLELMFDYQTNVAAYPTWQAYLREHRPPTLVVWGKHDALFTIDGALAYGRDVPDAEIHLLNAGHFALDEEVNTVAGLVRYFLAGLGS